MAVAIWDHEPDARSLLERRIARGWQPMPTAMRDGDVVLGFAACLRAGKGTMATAAPAAGQGGG